MHPAGAPPRPRDGWAGHAFGVAITGTFPAPGLPSRSVAGRHPATSLTLLDAAALGDEWDTAGARRVDERREGEVPKRTVDHHPELGWLLWGDGFGSYLLAPDGSTVRCAPAPVEPWRWQLFLVGQVLPLVALLRGFEPFHASVVELPAGAVALTGASGAGKSSLALNLIMRGASFVADDVLSVNPTEPTVHAWPGPALASISHAEAATIEPGRRLGDPIGADGDAIRVAVERVADRAVPLAGIYVLRRTEPTGGDPIRELPRLDPRLLLASTFNPFVRDRGRLQRQLDTCARLLGEVPLFEASVTSGVGAAELAALIEVHASGALSG